MFSDVVGYTAMTQSDEELTLQKLEEHRSLMRPIFAAHRGHEVKTIGDAFLVEFQSALDAVNCAIVMQQSMTRSNEGQTSLRRMAIRVGIHVGDVIEKDGDVYGDTVNIASRVEKVADAGGIAITEQVYQQVRNTLQFPVTRMGEFQLKNVDSRVSVYSVSPQWQAATAQKHGPSRRIAVLPLKNIGGDQEDEYLADGLTEELIASLSSVPGYKVIARTSMMRFKNSGKSVSEIGRELDAGYVLEGSLRRSGDQLRTSVQLIEAATEELVWSRHYDKELRGALSMQQDIADETAFSLRSRLHDDLSPASRKSITKNGEAFILYLKAGYRLTRHTRSDLGEAISLYEKAIALDPDFASAYAMLAQCHLFLGFFGHVPQKQAFERAEPYLKKAIEIDDDLDRAHMLMGRLLVDRDWDWRAGEAELRRAIEISPNSAEAHYRYALLLQVLGRTNEAEAELVVAEELDPLSVAVNQVSGTFYYYTGRYDKAIERFHRALEMDPKAVLPRNNLGLAYLEVGRNEDAISEIRKAVEMDGGNYFFKVDLCYAYCRAGMPDEARMLLSQALSAFGDAPPPPVVVAGMRACLGDKDGAFAMLERAYAEHSAYLPSIRDERWFEGMRTDERFVSLLKRMKLV